MNVYPEPPGSSTAAFASSTADYAVGKPAAPAALTSQPQEPPPSYAPPADQRPANAYGFFAPTQYGAPPAGYGFAPTSYGYPVGPTAPQARLQNNQNVQVNFVSATALPPMIVTQPAPYVMTPQSYLGWSIFNFLCCFWPLGLAAIIYSSKVFSARSREEAQSHSITARNLNIAATVIAPILVIVIVGAVVGSAASRSARSGSYNSNVDYYYYSYGYYYYYYSRLMYYTYYQSYSTFVNSGTYSYAYTQYKSVTASKYTSDYYYQYAQGVYHSG